MRERSWLGEASLPVQSVFIHRLRAAVVRSRDRPTRPAWTPPIAQTPRRSSRMSSRGIGSPRDLSQIKSSGPLPARLRTEAKLTSDRIQQESHVHVALSAGDARSGARAQNTGDEPAVRERPSEQDLRERSNMSAICAKMMSVMRETRLALVRIAR